ncbi:hypothetical protein [Streptomyces sp. NPDC004284]|uniref:hypothetical protein n=1 Tax=Streptomyces sp. NPDC004284 TaxID=3364695 RepID=UPI0036C0705E
MSAISTRGRMRFTVFTEPFGAKGMCRFLARDDEARTVPTSRLVEVGDGSSPAWVGRRSV